MADETLEGIAFEINRVSGLHQRTINSGLEQAKHLGLLLLMAKKELKHGEFMSWCEAQLPFSAACARRYMQIAKRWDEIEVEGPEISYTDAQRAIGNRKPLKRAHEMPGHPQYSVKEAAKLSSDGDLVDTIFEMVEDRETAAWILNQAMAKLEARKKSKTRWKDTQTA